MDITPREGHHLHIDVHGEGSPDVLLVHGWIVSGDVWHLVRERWPERGAGRLLTVDLRGTGWSSKPATGYAVDDHAADILAVLDALAPARPVLVGHSLGGVIAQRVAVLRPDALARLVLVCPVPASGQPLDDATVAFLHAQCAHHDGVRGMLSSLLTREVAGPTLERLVLSAAATSRGAFHEGFDSFRSANFGDRLAGIRAPTAVFAGELDPILPPAFVREAVADRIPGASFTILPACGHYPQIEDPDRLTGLLRELAAAS